MLQLTESLNTGDVMENSEHDVAALNRTASSVSYDFINIWIWNEKLHNTISI